MSARSATTKDRVWPFGLLQFLLVLGILIAGQLTVHHENQLYGDSSAKLSFCPENTVINCDLVNSSAYSELGGIPIALFAILTYLFVLFLLILRKKLPLALPVASWVGVLASLYSIFLAGISHFQIGYLCLWCLGLYLINFSIPVLIVLASGNSLGKFWREQNFSLFQIQKFSKFAIPLLCVLMGGSVFSQRTYRTHLKSLALSKTDVWKKSEFRFPSAFSRPISNAQGRMGMASLSLQERVGKGQLVAVMFLTPGVAFSDSFALKAKSLFLAHAPQGQLVAVSPLAAGLQTPEEIWEDFFQFSDLKTTPLLFDNDFKVGRALGIQLAPSLLLVDADGSLVATNLQNLEILNQLLQQSERGEKLPVIGDARNRGQGSSESLTCAPSFKLKDLLSRNEVSFSSKVNSKKPSLLVFWNALCKHCQIELPKLIALSQKHQEPFRVFTISRLRPGKESGVSHRELTEKYVKDTRFPWPVLVDSGLVSTLYKVDSTPTTVVISPEGFIQEVWKGVQPDLEEKFQSASRQLASSENRSCLTEKEFPHRRLSFKVHNAQGKTVEIKDLLKKPTLIHFTAKECQSCQQEILPLQRFSREAKKRGIDTIEVSLDKLNGAAFYGPHGGIFEEIDVGYSLPRTYLVNEKGEVLKKFLGAQNWDDETFKELAFTWFQ